MNARKVMPLGLAAAPQIAPILQGMSAARGGGMPSLNLPPIPPEKDPLDHLLRLAELARRVDEFKRKRREETDPYGTGVFGGVADPTLPPYVLSQAAVPATPVPSSAPVNATDYGDNPINWIGRLLNLG